MALPEFDTAVLSVMAVGKPAPGIVDFDPRANVPVFATKATAEDWAPSVAPDFIQTAGALAVGDGGGTVYVPGVGIGGFTLNLIGGGTQDYKPGDMRGVDIRVFGANPNNTPAQNNAALVLALTMASEIWIPTLASGDHFDVDGEHDVPAHTKVRGAGWPSRIRQTVREKNIFIAGDYSSFEGLHLIGDGGVTGVAFTKNIGIYGSGKRGLMVQNCFIEKCESGGIQLRDCYDYKVQNNTLFANQWGAFNTSGDIVSYSGVVGGRGIITGNHCLSNNSQGIIVDTLGNDLDIIIANNVVVTLDPSTCTEGGTWTEAVGDYDDTLASIRRRHSISSYTTNTVSGPRTVIANNICRNTRWTGIYKPGGGDGEVVIQGNICQNNGTHVGNSISGGIHVNCFGRNIISNNIVAAFQNNVAGGIQLSDGDGDTSGSTKVYGNLITDSLGFGIGAGASAAELDILNNTIIGAVGRSISIVNSGGAAQGGHSIRGNKIKRTSGNSVEAIFITTPTTAKISTIADNDIEGFDNSNAVVTNAGIRTVTPLVTRVLRNRIRNFHVAVTSTSYFTAATRHASLIYDDNIIEDCNAGFGFSAAATAVVVPLAGNRFINVTNKMGHGATVTVAGVKCAYICRKDDDRLVVLELAAAPTVGTWAAGDRAEYPAPAAGASPGAVCTAGGNPGTWNAQAALAA
ncbi:MAG: right-handed parallel beta-helix repeat-containing protein [Mesorhizobium sp.]|nr:MAG: right-handed parallel beta-helix repeat-containing protein [Mesorhizobium sp.]